MERFIYAMANAALEHGEERQLLLAARQVFEVSVLFLRQRLEAARRRVANRGREARRQDTQADHRPILPLPAGTAELTPTLHLLDEVLVSVEADVPPFRNLEHRLARVTRRPLSKLHQLVAEGDEPLPAPPMATIKVVDEAEAAMIIEEHVRFVRADAQDEEQDRQSVRLQPPFVRAYAPWEGSQLPRVAGIATVPMVLPDGVLKSGRALDQELDLIFDVEPVLDDALRQIGHVSLEEAQQTYSWLCDEWLCDVATDDAGRAVIIALALTVIERHLLPERPAFFVAASQRGSGKTTVLNMVSTAITGSMASAASWSFDDEERRKAVFSYLREGAALVVHDNIPRGSALSCPTIERALTSRELSDRVLGESRSETVPTATIIAFTGNNISPKGDMASRSLVANLATDRPDPENRNFAHDDVLAWTRARRIEILGCLYTLLLLDRAKPNRAKTRFKDWWTLIGHPIELVAGVDFEEIFRTNDQFDEEAQGATDFLAMMDRYLKGERSVRECEFTAADVVKLCKSSSPWITGRSRSDHEPDPVALKSALEEASGRPFTGDIVNAHRVAKKLKAIEERPVEVDGVALKLIVLRDHEGNRYRIERI